LSDFKLYHGFHGFTRRKQGVKSVSIRVIRSELIGFSFFFAEIDAIHPIVFYF